MGIIEPTTRSLVDEVVAAFGALATDGTAALERLRELYDPQISFEDPIQRVEGLAAFLDLNRRLLRRMRRLEIDVTDQLGTEQDFALVWRMRLEPRLGPSLEVHGVSHMRAVGGRITYQRDYWDLAELVASAVPFGHRLLRVLLRPLA